MTPQEMWNAYKQINPSIGDEIDAWAFGVEADLLADLVLKGEKTATASAYDLYALEDEPLPQEGTFDIILDSQDQAVCIVEITKVSVEPFNQVSAQHAFKECFFFIIFIFLIITAITKKEAFCKTSDPQNNFFQNYISSQPFSQFLLKTKPLYFNFPTFFYT